MKHYIPFLLMPVCAAFFLMSCTSRKTVQNDYFFFPKNSSELPVESRDKVLLSAQKMACLNYAVSLSADSEIQGKSLATRRLNEVRSVLEEAGIKNEDIKAGLFNMENKPGTIPKNNLTREQAIDRSTSVKATYSPK